MVLRLLLPLTLVLSLAAPALAQEGIGSDPNQKTWRSRESYRENHFVIVKKDGAVIRAAEPFKIKGSKAIFRILVDFKEGPLTSMNVDDIDLEATEKANKPKPPEPVADEATPAVPSTERPVYGTRDISTLLATEEMRAERDRIKRRREETREAQLKVWEATQKAREAGQSSAPAEAAVSPAELELAKDGRIQNGMTHTAVVIAWGPPDKKQRQQVEGQVRDVWTYLARGQEPYRVTLADGKVVQIQNGERLLYSASLTSVAETTE